MNVFNWVEKFSVEKRNKNFFLTEKAFWMYLAVEIEFVS